MAKELGISRSNVSRIEKTTTQACLDNE
ncbi:hypothetical protein [Paenibacillus andongensis]